MRCVLARTWRRMRPRRPRRPARHGCAHGAPGIIPEPARARLPRPLPAPVSIDVAPQQLMHATAARFQIQPGPCPRLLHSNGCVTAARCHARGRRRLPLETGRGQQVPDNGQKIAIARPGLDRCGHGPVEHVTEDCVESLAGGTAVAGIGLEHGPGSPQASWHCSAARPPAIRSFRSRSPMPMSGRHASVVTAYPASAASRVSGGTTWRVIRDRCGVPGTTLHEPHFRHRTRAHSLWACEGTWVIRAFAPAHRRNGRALHASSHPQMGNDRPGSIDRSPTWNGSIPRGRSGWRSGGDRLPGCRPGVGPVEPESAPYTRPT